MKNFNSEGNRSGLLKVAFVAVAAVLGLASCQKEYNLDETVPEWLGSSIYEYLVDNGYTTYQRLIDDLGYQEVMSRTGSKTLFIADEAAVNRFYAKGIFKKADGTNVTRYEDLSVAQKKLMLFGAMLNNVYQVAMLSSTEGTPPVEGDAMRRISSISIWDTVPYLTPEVMPENKYWNDFRNRAGIRCLMDATDRPMVFFTNKFLTLKKITGDDYDFLFNQGRYAHGNGREGITHQPQDASVNGVNIKTQNIKCFNGFIDVMEEVIYPLPNMAEFLTESESTKIYGSLLERYCAPYYRSTNDIEGATPYLTQTYNRLNPDSQVDTVYQKRYFSKRSQGNNELNITAYNVSVAETLLKFDPGWSSYYSSTASTTAASVALQQNMGVMLVPDDDAMLAWWLTGGGKTLRERYGKPELAGLSTLTMDQFVEDIAGVPDDVIIELLNNNMLNSFVNSVPSKFANVLDDANDPMGLETKDVKSVQMCSNGAIYFTNTVFSPTSYRSVSFPALVGEALKIIYWSIHDDVCGFKPYLNSMVSTYSFFIPKASIHPTLEGLEEVPTILYLDPVSGGEKYTQAIAFYYDESQIEYTEKVQAKIYRYHLEDGQPVIDGKIADDVDFSVIKDRLEDLLDYHIIIGDVEDGNSLGTPSRYQYFQTKGRGTVRFTLDGTGKRTVWGGYQVENNSGIEIDPDFVYDMKKSNGNGRTYIIDEPLASSDNSVYDIVSNNATYPEFATFADMMLPVFANGQINNHMTGGTVVSTFNTYHYTVYVPKKETLDQMLADYKLIDAEMISDLSDYYDDLQAGEEEDYVKAMTRLSKVTRGSAKTTFAAKKAEFEAANAGCNIWNPADAKYAQFWNEANAIIDACPDKEGEIDHTSFLHADYIASLEKWLTDFVKYHIQDNSVYVGGEFKIDTIHVNDPYAHYETAYMNSKAQFEKLSVRSTPDGVITVIDAKNNTHNVITTPVGGQTYYNIMCREYEYNAATNPTQLETSSFAVIHLIGEPLDNGVPFTYFKF